MQAEQPFFKIFINNKIFFFNKRYTILQSCGEAHNNIPRFCYHPKLTIAANCRMCLVQVEDSLKPVASCAVTISDNLKIFTNTTLVKKARESVLEFLLINHPLDCPICDQGGECDLQDQTLFFGSDRGRFYEKKRAVKDIILGTTVKTFMSRCIHCTRCVRFVAEITGSNEIGLMGRGNFMRISTFLTKILSSELSGNVADICPVGALTSKPYAFTARPWELKSLITLDVFDGFGNNIKVDIRGNEIMRVLPYSIRYFNEDWITDKARLSFDGLLKQKVVNPVIKVEAFNLISEPMGEVNISWAQILALLHISISIYFCFYINNLKLNFNLKKKPSLKILIGQIFDYEAAVALKHLSFFINKKESFFDNLNNKICFNPVFFKIFQVNLNIFAFTRNKAFFLLGFNVKKECPIFNVKLLKLINIYNCSVNKISNNFTLNYTSSHLGISTKKAASILRGRVPLFKLFSNFGDCQQTPFFNTTNLLVLGGQTIINRYDSNTLVNILVGLEIKIKATSKIILTYTSALNLFKVG